MEKPQANYLIMIKDQDVLRDISTLVSFYEPIIGAYGLALYLALINEAQILKQLNYPKFELDRLYQISSLSEKRFGEALKKLESLRLVKSKVSRKTGSKKYEIFAPLEPSEFFENELFEKTLIAKIGADNVEALKFLAKEKNDPEIEDEFEDVTAVFEDVFAQELAEITTTPTVKDVQFTNLRSSKKTMLEKMLDLPRLSALLKKQGVILNYNSRKVKKSLNWALSVYNFNEKKLAQLMITSYEFEKKGLNIKTFENKVQELVTLRKASSALQSEETFLEIKDETAAKEPSFGVQIQEKNPEIVVQKLTKVAPDLATQKMIQTLKEDYRLENGAVNYLIEFSCFKNNQRIVVNYIYKIANSLREFGITTANEVFFYLYQLKKSVQQKQVPGAKPNLNQNLNFQKRLFPLSYDEIVKLTKEI